MVFAMTRKVTIALTKKEAELYRSHGLHREAITLYTKLLDTTPDIPPTIEQAIKAKIGRIRHEMDAADTALPTDISSSEVQSLKAGWCDHNNPLDIFNTAAALKEIGLYHEAVEQYRKLLGLDYPFLRYAPDMVACLLKAYSPDKLIEHVETLIQQTRLQDLDEADLRFSLAVIFERNESLQAALALYQTVMDSDADYEGLEAKIEQIKKQLAANQTMASFDQPLAPLQCAVAAWTLGLRRWLRQAAIQLAKSLQTVLHRKRP